MFSPREKEEIRRIAMEAIAEDELRRIEQERLKRHAAWRGIMPPNPGIVFMGMDLAAPDSGNNAE